MGLWVRMKDNTIKTLLALSLCAATVSYENNEPLRDTIYIDVKRTRRLSLLRRAFPSVLLVRYVL